MPGIPYPAFTVSPVVGGYWCAVVCWGDSGGTQRLVIDGNDRRGGGSIRRCSSASADELDLPQGGVMTMKIKATVIRNYLQSDFGIVVGYVDFVVYPAAV